MPNEQENIPHSHIRDLDREHSRIPFQHIPRALQMLLLSGVCSVKNCTSEVSCQQRSLHRIHQHFPEPSAAFAVMGFDPFRGALARPVVWPAKRGRDFAGKGFFPEPDRENLLEDFCATAAAKTQPCKIFPSGSAVLAQSQRRERWENTGPQRKCELGLGCGGTRLCVRHTFWG